MTDAGGIPAGRVTRMSVDTHGRLGRPFTLLWTANTISALGDGVAAVAAPLWLAARTDSPLVVSGAMFAATLPWLLFSLLSGGLVDRLDRRRVMVLVDWLRGGVLAVLGLMIGLGHAGPALMYGVLFLIGTGETLFRAASQSVLPAVVRPGQLERANGRLSAARSVAHDMIAGPVGGFLFTLAAAVPFLLDAGSFLAGAVLLALLPGTFRATRAAQPAETGAPDGRAPDRRAPDRPEPLGLELLSPALPAPAIPGPDLPAPEQPGPAGAAVGPAAAGPPDRTSLLAEIAVGLRFLFGHRLLRTLAWLIGLLNITLVAATSTLVLLAKQRLGLGSVGYGLLYSAMAVGGLAGALVGDRLVRRFTASVTLRVGLLIETAFHLTLALSASPIVVGVAMGVFGVHGMLWMIVTTSIRQRLTPPEMLGRVNSAYLFLAAGGNAFGALLGGLIATRFGLIAPYWIGFVVAALVTAATWRVLDRRTIAAAYEVPASALAG
jgi:MFS family permease